MLKFAPLAKFKKIGILWAGLLSNWPKINQLWQFLRNWANFLCTTWTNIGKIVLPSGHTEDDPKHLRLGSIRKSLISSDRALTHCAAAGKLFPSCKTFFVVGIRND